MDRLKKIDSGAFGEAVFSRKSLNASNCWKKEMYDCLRMK
jgi:hypothetical protein